jgi:hypothetical protein
MPRQVIDMTGQRVGKLTVLMRAGFDNWGHALWKCKCDCGNIAIIKGYRLRLKKNPTKSCGCLVKQAFKKIGHIGYNVKDMVGKKIGRLTVIKRAGSNNDRLATWQCRCDCGSITTVSGKALRSKKNPTLSCGCLRRETLSKLRTRDLTNKRFKRLKALKPTNKRYLGSIVWLCKCDCGNDCEVPSYSLVSGNTKSCGCLNKDLYESMKIDL